MHTDDPHSSSPPRPATRPTTNADMTTYTILAFDNSVAAEVWGAYLSTTKGFAPEQRAYAATLPTPARVLLATTPEGEAVAELLKTLLPAAPHSVASSRSCVRTTTAAAKMSHKKAKAELLTQLARTSMATVLLGDGGRWAAAGGGCERKVLYMHTRSPFLRTGLASALLREAQELHKRATYHLNPNNVALYADAAACRTWGASLVLLRSWFQCSQHIWTCDPPRPGETPSGNSHHLAFRWTPAASEQEHLAFVRVAAKKQLARRSERAKEYGAELNKVVQALERKLAAAVPTQ